MTPVLFVFFVASSLRLAGGTSSSGRVEIRHDGEWGTVCDDGWTVSTINWSCLVGQSFTSEIAPTYRLCVRIRVSLYMFCEYGSRSLILLGFHINLSY